MPADVSLEVLPAAGSPDKGDPPVSTTTQNLNAPGATSAVQAPTRPDDAPATIVNAPVGVVATATNTNTTTSPPSTTSSTTPPGAGPYEQVVPDSESRSALAAGPAAVPAKGPARESGQGPSAGTREHPALALTGTGDHWPGLLIAGLALVTAGAAAMYAARRRATPGR
ncbi:hypothetical protein ABZ816_19405 [Actinosynnema sp. NPDC047251]|uniref:hypothetical protein n=1 Tax=Saccharothrix espanaensis TaxID=103731 RepID=UPI0011DDA5D3|nr:hypothetical protein [Saccharothrix espanaensis]